MVQGTVNGTNITATQIHDGIGFGPGVRGLGMGGTVTAVSGSAITITGKDGKTYTVDAGSATAQKLQTIFESEGVTAIPALGQEFDPNQHEAVIYEEAGDGSDGIVVAELQKGYKLRDRVLRPTMVKVGKA